MSKRIVSFVIAVACVLVTTGASRADGFVLVKNAKNTVSKLSRSEVKAMFSGKTTSWSTGTSITVVIGTEDAPAMVWLATEMFGTSARALLTKIRQAAFSGEMPKPIHASDDAATVAGIRSGVGTIGVVSADAARALPGEVVVLSVH
jgi:hypothetical protein